MKRYETLETLFGKVDLSFAEKVLNEAYHPKDTPGRPPRKPLGGLQGSLAQKIATRSERQDAREAVRKGLSPREGLGSSWLILNIAQQVSVRQLSSRERCRLCRIREII